MNFFRKSISFILGFCLIVGSLVFVMPAEKVEAATTYNFDVGIVGWAMRWSQEPVGENETPVGNPVIFEGKEGQRRVSANSYYIVLNGERTDKGTLQNPLNFNYVYKGIELRPTIHIRNKNWGEITSSNGFTIQYKNNINAHKNTATTVASVTITPKSGSGYTGGPITVYYQINARRALWHADVSGVRTKLRIKGSINEHCFSKKIDGKWACTEHADCYYDNNNAPILEFKYTGKEIFPIISEFANSLKANEEPYANEFQTDPNEIVNLTNGNNYTIKYNRSGDRINATDNVNDNNYFNIVGTGNFRTSDSDNVGYNLNSEFSHGGGYGHTFKFRYKINKADIVDDIFNEDITYTNTHVYTGQEIKPKPIIRFNNKVLKEGVDYNLSYKNNKNIGTATMIIKGTGNFKGTREVNFEIEEASISGLAFSTIPTQTYTGGAIEPDVVVKNTTSGQILTKGTDYTIEYENNIDVTDTATAIVTIPGYNGEQRINFAIAPQNISDKFNFKLNTSSKTYTGEEITVEDESYFVYKNTNQVAGLVCSTDNGETGDYLITYQNNKNTGEATVTVNGINNYKGTITKTFQITQADINDAEITFQHTGNYVYTGSEVKPKLKVTFNGKTLVENSDYILRYENNINAYDEPQVTVCGINNFDDEKAENFEITPIKAVNNLGKLNTGFVVNFAQETFYGDSTNVVNSITYNGNHLQKDLDYTITYDNNTNAGEANFSIEFIGNYTGETSNYNFTIKQKNIKELDSVQQLLAIEKAGGHSLGIYTYKNGEEITPEISIKGLTINEDYEVVYSDNTNAGIATATITGIGNYKENFSLTFKIATAKFDDFPQIESTYEYTGRAIEPYDKNDFSPIQPGNISIVYKDNINVGIATAQIEIDDGNYKASYSQTFKITPKEISDEDFVCNINNNYTDDESSVVYTGTYVCPYKVKRGSTLTANDYTITYDNNINAGEAIAHIDGRGNYTGSLIMYFNINPLDLSSGSGLSVSYDKQQTYTGSEFYSIVKDVKYNNKSLVYGDDYLIVDNDYVDVNKNASFGIQFVGNYTGDREYFFEITKGNINDFNIFGIESSYEYSGYEIEPDIFVYNANYDDYTVTYRNNINVGTATATITGKDNLEGIKTIDFKITPADITGSEVFLSYDDYTYTGKEIQPEIDGINSVFDGDITKKNFTFTYEDNINVGIAKVNITAQGNYTGNCSAVFTISPMSICDVEIENEDDIREQTYSGTAIKPEIILTNPNTSETLKQDIDYTVGYKNNVNANSGYYSSSPEIVIIGIGNFTEKFSYSFNISPFDVKKNNSSISFSSAGEGASYSATYSGEEQEPELTVKVNGKILTQGTDYEVSYYDNENAGQATAQISFIGNYIAEYDFEKTFAIKPLNLASEGFEVKTKDVAYTGDELETEVIVTYKGNELNEGYDYELQYFNNVWPGTCSVIVTGIGNYAGKIDASFNILDTTAGNINDPVNINTQYCEEIDDYDVTGYPICPEVVFENNLVKNRDYKVTYANNVNVGLAEVRITGINGYTGEKIIKFNIYSKDISYLDYTSIPNQIYTGKAVKPNMTIRNGTAVLKNGVDYTITYTGNYNTGLATATFRGIGNYTGEIFVDFIIRPQQVTGVKVSKHSATHLKITWDKLNNVNGYKIYTKGGKLLKTISSKEITQCIIVPNYGQENTYKVCGYKVIDYEDYNGVASEVVSVTPKLPTPTNFKLTSKSKTITVKYKKVKTATKYQILMATKKKGKYKVVYTGKSNSVKIKKLKKGKTYFFKVRAFKVIQGIKKYSNYTSIKKIKCK